MKRGYVYILSNFARTTLYIGVTNNLADRLGQHRSLEHAGFTKKYKLKYLIYYEVFERVADAIAREKQLKRWHREWKLRLIRRMNPEMKDLSEIIPWN
jgi:putative endonuclease